MENKEQQQSIYSWSQAYRDEMGRSDTRNCARFCLILAALPAAGSLVALLAGLGTLAGALAVVAGLCLVVAKTQITATPLSGYSLSSADIEALRKRLATGSELDRLTRSIACLDQRDGDILACVSALLLDCRNLDAFRCLYLVELVERTVVARSFGAPPAVAIQIPIRRG